jgi:mRNA interferase RelE/StbE
VTYAVFLHPKAAKELEKTDSAIRSHIRSRVRESRIGPEKVGKLLKHSSFWGLQVGDYRVIYEVDRSRKQVIVLFVGHRSKIYDDFSRML